MRLAGAPFTEAERLAVIEAARARLGLKWGHQGCSDWVTDCIGLAWMSVNAVRPLPRPPLDHGRLPVARRLRAGLIEFLGEPVDRDPQPGDVVSVRWAGEERHVAIVTPHLHYGIGLIHADNTATGGGRVVEHGVNERWRRRIVEVFEL